MLEVIRSLPAYQQLLAEIRQGGLIKGVGLPRAARLPILAALHSDLNRPLLYITSRSDRALALFDELAFWAPQIDRRLFPEPNPLFYERGAWGTVTRRDRLQALAMLAQYHLPGASASSPVPLLIAPVRAVMTRSMPRRDFLKASHTLRLGQKVQPGQLQRQWAAIGYQYSEIVIEPGQFSRRGGILDIWAPAETRPVRLDFFGDEVESMRSFDPATQRTVASVQCVTVTPARELLPGYAEAKGISLVPTTWALDPIEEFFLPLVHPAPATLLDYLPRRALVLVDDLDTVQMTANEIEEQAVQLRHESVREGTLPQDFPSPYLSWSELQDNLGARCWFELGRLTAPERHPLAQAFSLQPRFGGHMKTLLNHLADTLQKGETVVLVSRQASRLNELWQERPESATHAPTCREGTLSEGWELTLSDGSKLHLLTDSEVFGWERPKPRQRQRPVAASPEANYADLKLGDWVVHVDYGIGRYGGLVRRQLDGSERDFMLLEYENGDQLYVPVHQADRVSRYIGPGGEPPSLTRLGTAEWHSAKQRVREGVIQVARDLLDLYARRQLVKGKAFSPDTPWQQELEASFPYIETEDQLRAIGEVKRDMEKPRPMDRLLCGDVGYGKTEVALRAAFKAVMDGKQVAMLVPTTVLAQQHFETFRQRLAAYPVEVEMLSRFRLPREQERILKRLSEGAVDIVIGTHRLVQPDVAFKDLGLVIVDEEQRFGVTHKEYLKRLRTEVDMLTLTATPIPRTLYMALTGVRDISNITTPPEERLPIVTHIGPYSPRLVRQAILRELERGGQVFFVHNRVQTITAMANHVRKLVPEARLGIAHGQMPEMELSRVMRQFTGGDIEVLLSTSIIESGLDIPNANTLIVDRADTFGLAQLYQLRGRVGRGAHRAYAYFFRHRRRNPTPEGMGRMEIIAENTQLGAGYSIAMRDLEMRGAGEMLGTRQHGYIAAVGFHLYTRLLGQAVRELRNAGGIYESISGFPAGRNGRLPVNVDLPITVGVPGDYVADQNLRLQLYRRLADLESEQELQAFAEELKDRFGTPPIAVENLLYQMVVKLKAERAGLASVLREGDQIVLRYPPLPEGTVSRSLPYVSSAARAGKNAYWLPVDLHNDGWRQSLLGVLSAIIDSCQPS